MYYIIISIFLIIILYCLFLGCLERYTNEHFTWTHPCKHFCKHKAIIQKYHCSMLNSDEIGKCVRNTCNQGLHCENECNL